MTEYVAGFMFVGGDRVALVKKNRPKWQEGKYNGIGGHLESNETIHEAMAREFVEETGFQSLPSDWTLFNTLSGQDFKVHFFFTLCFNPTLQSTTDEQIVIVDIKDIDVYNAIPNLTWLIPMAKSMSHDRATSFLMWEKYD